MNNRNIPFQSAVCFQLKNGRRRLTGRRALQRDRYRFAKRPYTFKEVGRITGLFFTDNRKNGGAFSMSYRIEQVHARQILDSRGNPTVEAEVRCGDHFGRAAVPSGASTGYFEAAELRDMLPERYGGKSVERAVDNANREIRDTLIYKDITDQAELDRLMISLDGTEDKSRLGANAILAVSLAAARCAAASCSMPLYRYIGGCAEPLFPVPMLNVINGGKHADNLLDIQEFMLIPSRDEFPEMLRRSAEVYHALHAMLHREKLSTAVGDEGGFAPQISSTRQALDLLVSAIEKAGYQPGNDFTIGLDVAATEMADAAKAAGESGYLFEKTGEHFTAKQLGELYQGLARDYPVRSIEDPFGEEDWDAWRSFTEGNPIQIVGDDLFVTNETRLRHGIALHAANAVLIKPNQIGTLTETLETIRTARSAGYRVVVSHRSGDTEDDTIADLAVAVGAEHIKTGAPARAERTSKYNRLLRIYDSLAK